MTEKEQKDLDNLNRKKEARRIALLPVPVFVPVKREVVIEARQPDHDRNLKSSVGVEQFAVHGGSVQFVKAPRASDPTHYKPIRNSYGPQKLAR